MVTINMFNPDQLVGKKVHTSSLRQCYLFPYSNLSLKDWWLEDGCGATTTWFPGRTDEDEPFYFTAGEALDCAASSGLVGDDMGSALAAENTMASMALMKEKETEQILEQFLEQKQNYIINRFNCVFSLPIMVFG